MKKFYLLLIATAVAAVACQEYTVDLDQTVKVEISSMLKMMPADQYAFVGTSYPVFITLNSVHNLGEYDVAVNYTLNNKPAKIQIPGGSKEYSKDDSILVKTGVKKEIILTPLETGTYRISFTFKTAQGKEIGFDEINFEVTAPDMALMILKNDAEVLSLYERPAYIETSDNFTVRAFSLTEPLGNATLRVEQAGSSIVLKGTIRPGSVRLASAEDLTSAPAYIRTAAATTSGGISVADFDIEYDAVEIGKTKLKFTANSEHAQAILSDSINITAGNWGVVFNNTIYDENLKQFVRPDTWAGLTDSINYLIDVNFNNVGSRVFKVKFESLYPEKTALTWAKNLPWEVGSTYDYGEWYDFSDNLAGKVFYYATPGAGAYSDVIKITVKNGELGSEVEQHIKITFKQTEDFDFAVTFKHKSLPGDDPPVNDTILYSELENITTLVRLAVSDENPYSTFDYKIIQENADAVYRNIRYAYGSSDYSVRYGYFEASNTQYIQNYIDLSLVITNQSYDAYFGEFDFKYTARRVLDNKEKEITKHIVILDDRLDFNLGMAPGNARTDVYKNEPVTMFQVLYKTPSTNADDYDLTVSADNEATADVYLADKSLAYQKAQYNETVIPPATNAPDGRALAQINSGLVQIKGHTPGTATIAFKLRHKVTGAEKTITQTITCQDDPINYTLVPHVARDADGYDVPASEFGSTIHKRMHPRFKLRVSSSVNYSGNNNGRVKVRFIKKSDLVNEARVFNDKHQVQIFDTYYSLNVDTDHIFELRPAGNAREWAMPAGAEQQVQIEILRDNEEYAFTAQEEVEYTLRDYIPMQFNFSFERITSYNTIWAEKARYGNGTCSALGSPSFGQSCIEITYQKTLRYTTTNTTAITSNDGIWRKPTNYYAEGIASKIEKTCGENYHHIEDGCSNIRGQISISSSITDNFGKTYNITGYFSCCEGEGLCSASGKDNTCASIGLD